MAIVKALQEIETLQINKNILKTILIHMDSRINLDSLKNTKNGNNLIEAIRKKTFALEKENWHIKYTSIKAHAGHERNEPPDKLAKEATKESEI
jgi:ribonuclease HI